ILRAARRIGESLVFEISGERTWARLRAQMESLLIALYEDGALRGDTASDAFQVRCDRSTMSQADIDAGRLIAQVQLEAASPIDRIAVVFALDATGQVTLLTGATESAEVAA